MLRLSYTKNGIDSIPFESIVILFPIPPARVMIFSSVFVEEAIRTLGFSTLNIYRPGLLLGKRLEKRVGEGLGKIIFKLIDPFLLGTFSKYRSVKAETLARAMIEKSTIAKGINWFHFRQFKS